MPARDVQLTASQLQRDFDESFARAPATLRPGTLDLLVVAVQGQSYSLRLSEIAAVHTERRVVAVPSPDPKLLGLVGLRGGVAPVYDLALALGHARAEAPRWLLELRSPKPCTLAFAELEGHRRVPEATLAPAGGAGLHRLAAGSVASPTGLLTVIDLRVVYAELTEKPSLRDIPSREGRT